MWQQPQGFLPGWGASPLQPSSNPPSNPPPQVVDPTDWANKAAEWAQQKQVVEQQQQLQQQQQYYQQHYQQQPQLYQDQQQPQQAQVYHEQQEVYSQDPHLETYHQPQHEQHEMWPHPQEAWPEHHLQEVWRHPQEAWPPHPQEAWPQHPQEVWQQQLEHQQQPVQRSHQQEHQPLLKRSKPEPMYRKLIPTEAVPQSVQPPVPKAPPIAGQASAQASRPPQVQLAPQAPRPLLPQLAPQAPRPLLPHSTPQAPRPIHPQSAPQAPRPLQPQSTAQTPRPLQLQSVPQAQRPRQPHSVPQAQKPPQPQSAPQAQKQLQPERTPQARGLLQPQPQASRPLLRPTQSHSSPRAQQTTPTVQGKPPAVVKSAISSGDPKPLFSVASSAMGSEDKAQKHDPNPGKVPVPKAGNKQVPVNTVSVDPKPASVNSKPVAVQIQPGESPGNVSGEKPEIKASKPAPPSNQSSSTKLAQNLATLELAERMRKFKEQLEQMQNKSPLLTPSSDSSSGGGKEEAFGQGGMPKRDLVRGGGRGGMLGRGRGNFNSELKEPMPVRKLVNPEFVRGKHRKGGNHATGGLSEGTRSMRGAGVMRGGRGMRRAGGMRGGRGMRGARGAGSGNNVERYGPVGGEYDEEMEENCVVEEEYGFGDEYYDYEGYEQEDEGYGYGEEYYEHGDGEEGYEDQPGEYYEEEMGDEKGGRGGYSARGRGRGRGRGDGKGERKEEESKLHLDQQQCERGTRSPDMKDRDSRGDLADDNKDERDRRGYRHGSKDRAMRDHDSRDDRDLRTGHDSRDDHELRGRHDPRDDRDLRNDLDKKYRDKRDHDLRERDLRERDLRKQRDLRKRDLRERELRERDLRERDLRERDLRERDLRERDLRERDLRERDLRERELRERELRERELRERELRERDLRERALRERELRDGGQLYLDRTSGEETGRGYGYRKVDVIDYGHVGTVIRQEVRREVDIRREDYGHEGGSTGTRREVDGPVVCEGDSPIIQEGQTSPPSPPVTDYTTPSSYPGEKKKSSIVTTADSSGLVLGRGGGEEFLKNAQAPHDHHSKDPTAPKVASFDSPTIPSLQKEGQSTVIPGLGSGVEETAEQRLARINQEEIDLKDVLKSQIMELFGGLKGDKMVKSLEKVVNQLQTLKGLETSLKSLQSGESGAGKGQVVDEETATEEARKQVAALLATESDSDDGDFDLLLEKVDPYSKLQPSHRILEEDKPTPPSYDTEAREFDGTYSIKPKVFSTYSAKGESVHQGDGYSAPGHPDSRGGSGLEGRAAYGAGGGASELGREQYRGDQSQYRAGYGSQTDPGDFRGRSGGNEDVVHSAYDGIPLDGDGSAGKHTELGKEHYRGDQSQYRADPGDFRDRRSGDSLVEYHREGVVDYDGIPFDADGNKGDVGSEARPYRGGPPPAPMERGGRGYDRENYGEPPSYRGEGETGGFPRYGAEEHWDQRQGYQPPHASGRHSGPRRVEDPHFHHATPMDIVPNEDKGNISDKLETIDYSHGALGSGRVGSSAIQSVDYHHGQGGVPDQSPPIGGMVGNFSNPIHSLAASVPPMIPNPAAYQPPVLPDLAAYGGFPAYANYEGYPPGGGSYQGLFPAGAFFSGLDPAAIFAAYTEQTGGDSKRKVLPMWLKEELKKMEKKNAKAMEKEAQEKMMKGEGSKRPTWRDEMDSGGEGAEEERERAKEERERERNKKTSKTSRFYRNSNSASPDSDVEPRSSKKRRKVSEPVEDPEEKKMKKMLDLRKMLTEILLQVTTQEIKDIATEVYEDEKSSEEWCVKCISQYPAEFKFVFKEPKIKPKRALKPNVLATLSMYESSSDSDEDKEQSPAGAKILSKPSKAFSKAISRAFEDTSKGSDGRTKKQRVSKWDVTEPSGSSSKKSSDKSKSTSKSKGSSSSSSSSKSSPSSSSRRSSSQKSSSSSSSSSRSRGSSRRSSKSPPRAKTRIKNAGVVVGESGVVSLNTRWSTASGSPPLQGSGQGSGSAFL